ncbi:hypothetical protein [Mucilaginibacter conchicola]|nr:hypothetical protein [Mucilaginibacter conchicola]
MKYVSIIGYAEVFNEPTPNNPLEFVKHLPTEYLMYRLARINAMLFHEPNLHLQTRTILEQAIFPDTPELSERIRSLTSKVNERERGIFSGPSISLFLKRSLENYTEGEPGQKVIPIQVNWDIFRTILIFNDIFYSAIHGVSLESFEGMFRLSAIQQNHLRSNMYHKLITFIKYAFVSKFIEQDKELKERGFRFCKFFGLGNPWLFGRFFLELLTQYGAADEGGNPVLKIEGLPPEMINYFSLQNDDLIERKDVSLSMDVIPKPFFKLPDDQFMILDYNYFQYASEFGFFYAFYQATQEPKTDRFRNFNSFNSYVALEYFEKYLVKSFLDVIFFRKSQKIVSTDRYQDFIVKASGTNVLLIEVKMIDIHPKTVEDLNFERFVEEIDKNFLSQKSIQGKDKGAFQLLRQMQHLSKDGGELQRLLGIKRAQAMTVYPIVIYNDPNLDMAGVNEYVAGKFADSLEASRESFCSVKPLVMMNVNLLIEFLHIFKQSPQSITNIFDAYFKYVKGHKRQYQQYRGAHNYRLYNTSFSAYLKGKFRDDMLNDIIKSVKNNFDLNINEYGQDRN